MCGKPLLDQVLASTLHPVRYTLYAEARLQFKLKSLFNRTVFRSRAKSTLMMIRRTIDEGQQERYVESVCPGEFVAVHLFEVIRRRAKLVRLVTQFRDHNALLSVH